MPHPTDHTEASRHLNGYPPGSDFSPLTEEQIEDIAERAAGKAIAKLTDHVYKEVGKNVIDKLFWIVGSIATAAWLAWQSGLIDLSGKK